jgi:hypothetical protein
VFAADAYNEAYGSSWARGNTVTDWDRGAELLGDGILGVCPRLLIFVSGAGHRSISCNANCNLGLQSGYTLTAAELSAVSVQPSLPTGCAARAPPPTARAVAACRHNSSTHAERATYNAERVRVRRACSA